MSKKDFYETNANRIQFFINLGVLLITLIAVIVSFYYSRANLKLSTKQYDSTIKQFGYQRRLDSLRNISDSIKDERTAQRLKNDSILQAKKDKSQYDRNKKQDLLNDRQLTINNQQLLASKKQVQALQDQVNEQKAQYKSQLLEKRPFFVIDNITIDTSVSYKSRVSFVFSNRGLRSAHVDGTILAFFNLKLGCNSITPDPGNIDAPPQQYFLNTSQINIYPDCLRSSSTIYFLLVFYKDFATGESKTEPIFFTYYFKENHFFYTRLVENTIPSEFIAFLNKKGIGKTN